MDLRHGRSQSLARGLSMGPIEPLTRADQTVVVVGDALFAELG